MLTNIHTPCNIFYLFQMVPRHNRKSICLSFSTFIGDIMIICFEKKNKSWVLHHHLPMQNQQCIALLHSSHQSPPTVYPGQPVLSFPTCSFKSLSMKTLLLRYCLYFLFQLTPCGVAHMHTPHSRSSRQCLMFHSYSHGFSFSHIRDIHYKS